MSEQYNNFLSAKVRVFYSNVDTIDRGPKMLGIDCRPLGLLLQGVDMIVLNDTASNHQRNFERNFERLASEKYREVSACN